MHDKWARAIFYLIIIYLSIDYYHFTNDFLSMFLSVKPVQCCITIN